MIDVLVLNYNDYETTFFFVNTIKNYKNIKTILVVDNDSRDGSFDRLKKMESTKIKIVSSKSNRGYGAGNNFGIRYLIDNFNSDYILLSNPDVFVDEVVISKMEDFLRSKTDYAIVAPFMLNSNGEKVPYSVFRIPQKWEYILSMDFFVSRFIKPFLYKNIEKVTSPFFDVGAVSGSLFLMDAKKMLQYGMFDEHMFLYCEEVVLGIKMKNGGKKIALLPNETFVHNHSVSISKSISSMVKRHKIHLKSKLYVIKEYYGVDFWTFLFAYLFSKISIVEILMISIMKKVCKINS